MPPNPLNLVPRAWSAAKLFSTPVLGVVVVLGGLVGLILLCTAGAAFSDYLCFRRIRDKRRAAREIEVANIEAVYGQTTTQ